MSIKINLGGKISSPAKHLSKLSVWMAGSSLPRIFCRIASGNLCSAATKTFRGCSCDNFSTATGIKSLSSFAYRCKALATISLPCECLVSHRMHSSKSLEGKQLHEPCEVADSMPKRSLAAELLQRRPDNKIRRMRRLDWCSRFRPKSLEQSRPAPRLLLSRQ